MGNSVGNLKSLLLPAVIGVLWLLAGLGYTVATDGRMPPAMAGLVFPETLPVHAQVFLNEPGKALVAGLTALTVAAAALALAPAPGKAGATPRHTAFFAAWMSITLAAVAGSAILGLGLALANWPLPQAEWIFVLASPALLTGAYWGVTWGWVPALLSTVLPARPHDDDTLPPAEDAAGRLPQRLWALAAFVVFAGALLVSLPLAAGHLG